MKYASQSSKELNKLFLLNFERLVMWMSLSTALGRFPSFSLRSFLLVGRLELLRLCQYPGEFAYPMLEHNHIVSHQFHVFLRKVLDKECIQLSECIDNMQVRTLLLLIRLPFYSRHILCRWNIYNILYYIQVCSLLVDRFNMTLSYHLRNVIVLLISFDLFSGWSNSGTFCQNSGKAAAVSAASFLSSNADFMIPHSSSSAVCGITVCRWLWLPTN